ncbi:MAG: NfeD family protein [Methanoregulaceae archaeon]|nr:NfeD family protein [Methanoregulaceae archaeon]
MVQAVGASFGWLLIVFGTLLMVAEAITPGFFVAVPGTVLIILGILILLGVDIFSSGIGVVVGVFIAIAAAGFTIWLYSRFSADTSPFTLSRDSLVGKEGQVTTEVNQDTITGKVRIGGTDWSARSTAGAIPAGRTVVVVESQGVHIVVKEVCV